MITAYFDDSGTHDTANVVIVAGVFGTEWQLTSLDRLWKPHIDRPLCGTRPTLTRFHATHCNASEGEFTGWTRTETDYFCHQLRTAIINSGVAAYGIALSRRDWNQIVRKSMRGFLGDAEGYAITQCFVVAHRWATHNTFDPAITFVFDRRIPEIERRGRAIGDAFEKAPLMPQIVGTAFLSSRLVRPLQAADLIAWEVYQHANEIFAAGKIQPPQRKELRHLEENMTIITQYGNRDSIRKIVAFVRSQQNHKFVKAAAAHFTSFDPSAPDYSYLSPNVPPSQKRASKRSHPRPRRPDGRSR